VVFSDAIGEEMHDSQLSKRSQREKALDIIRTKNRDDDRQIVTTDSTAIKVQGPIKSRDDAKRKWTEIMTNSIDVERASKDT
jgi:hypothetical protein